MAFRRGAADEAVCGAEVPFDSDVYAAGAGFVYAVAKDAEEREEDRVLRQRAEVILREYRRAEVYIGEGKLGRRGCCAGLV